MVAFFYLTKKNKSIIKIKTVKGVNLNKTKKVGKYIKDDIKSK